MKRVYEAPNLFVDEYVADTMIASSNVTDSAEWKPKNGNVTDYKNCWGCQYVTGEPSPSQPELACFADLFGPNGYVC